MLRPRVTNGVDGSDEQDGAAASAKLGLPFILNAGDPRSPPSRRRRLIAALNLPSEEAVGTSDALRPSDARSKEDKKRGRTCKIEGCPNYIVHKGLCCRHGGGKKCSIEGCNTSAKHWGLCWKHGGSIGCKVKNCSKRAKARGLCWGHGGGTKCNNVYCDKVAVSEGLCWAHGGGKRCLHTGCKRPGYERTLNYCVKHHAELSRSSEEKTEASEASSGDVGGTGSDTDVITSR